MKSPQYRILLIEPSVALQNCLKVVLKKNNYRLKISNDANEGISIALKKHYNLIICQNKLPNNSGYQVFKFLKNFLLSSGTAFYLLSEKLDLDDVLLGLEMGIDNFILLPVNEASLLNKIDNSIEKTGAFNMLDSEQFINFSTNSSMIWFLLEEHKIVQVSKQFSRLLNLPDEGISNKTINDFFIVNGNAGNVLKYRKLENGLLMNCCLKKIKQITNPNICLSFFMHADYGIKKSKIFVEVVPADIKSGLIIMKTLGYEQGGFFIYGDDLKIEKAKGKTKLTKRENEIFEESAKGYPVKQIAANLQLSERTVEKHRSNIMSKTNSHSILEAILILKNSEFSSID